MKLQKLNRFSLGCITAEGFLKEQMIRNKDGMGGHLEELEPEMIKKPYIDKTYVEQWDDGDQSGWSAEISGNYWTGLIELAFTLNDKDLIKKATDWVDEMLKKKKPDGYLGTYYEDDAKIYEDFNAWGTACVMRGLIAFYEATKRQDVIDAVYDCMVWFTKKWAGDRKTRYVGAAIIEPMIFCYHYTGDERLVKFAIDYEEFLCKDDLFGNSYQTFLQGEFRYNSNHTAGLGVLSRLPAILYTATGEKKYLDASVRILDNVYRKATHASGSPVSVSEYLAPVSSTAETEYCSYAYYNASYNYLGYITGNSKYGDRIEEMFYNGAQGARKKDERAIAYLSAPNQIYATDISSGGFGDMQVYSPCYPVACCPVNSVVVLGEFVRDMMFYDDEDNIYINVYGPCKLKYNNIEIIEKTLYPFRDTINFTINANKCFSIFFRIPDWCKKYEIFVNRENVNCSKSESGFAEIKRNWENGDSVTIKFSMEPKIIRIDDSDSSKKYPIAIKMGALLFSLHIEEKWEEYSGRPATKLLEGWHWYKAYPEFDEADVADVHEMVGYRKYQTGWNVALPESLSPDDVSIEEVETTGYVWESAKIKLHLKGYRAPFLCAPYPCRTFESFEDKQYVSEEMELTLVPYGCTNLRITYFPIADI